jgi:hypothetical protein
MTDIEEFLSLEIMGSSLSTRVKWSTKEYGIFYLWDLLDKYPFIRNRGIPLIGPVYSQEIYSFFFEKGIELSCFMYPYHTKDIEEIKIKFQIKYLENRLKELNNE